MMETRAPAGACWPPHGGPWRGEGEREADEYKPAGGGTGDEAGAAWYRREIHSQGQTQTFQLDKAYTGSCNVLRSEECACREVGLALVDTNTPSVYVWLRRGQVGATCVVQGQG